MARSLKSNRFIQRHIITIMARLIQRLLQMMILYLCAVCASKSKEQTPELQAKITYSVYNSQVFINIPTSFAPWQSVDVVQMDNRLNLEWDTQTGSSFLNCIDSKCKRAKNTYELGGLNEAAGCYNSTPDNAVSTITYVSPPLLSSLDGDRNVSFVVIVEYADGDVSDYAQVHTEM